MNTKPNMKSNDKAYTFPPKTSPPLKKGGLEKEALLGNWAQNHKLPDQDDDTTSKKSPSH